ncbi:MAG: MBL fold metallo-hydrolase [Pseudomonadota bacterium]
MANKRLAHAAAAVLVLAAAGTTFAQALAQVPAQARTVEDHLMAARRAARTDFTGTIARICIVPDAPFTIKKGGPPPVVPARDSWYAAPTQMFDNLYWVGTKVHSSWALKTSEGIILIDTLYHYAAEPEIVDGLKKLGLDPASIKYVIVSHAHGDHDEGARLLQDRFGARVVMSASDWDLIAQQDVPGGVPRRDIVAADGDKITLGDTTVTLVATPGHTQGTLSALFTVKDHGKPLSVVYAGGTAFNFQHDAAHYTTYINSQRKLAQAAADAGATVLMTNHSEFDDAYQRGRIVQVRQPGERHPYDMGAEAVARYFTVTSECAEAARMNLAKAP